jgi:hypothetical protein
MTPATRDAIVLLSERVNRLGATPTKADTILLNALHHLKDRN